MTPLHQELVNVTITKTWQKPATEGTANNIEVTLLQDGESYETRIISAEDCEVSADGTVWTYTFTDLPKYKSAGKEYAYTVEETEMVGWTTTYTEDNRGIINTVNGTTIVSVTKNWILPEGMTSAPVVTVKLLRNGSETGDTRTLVYNASGDTVYFTNLPKYDENGQLYTYAVEEAQGAYQMANAIEYGTEGMINTVVITNTVADETTTVSGTKYWNDDMTGRPDSITVALYVDGQAAVDSEGNPMTAEATAATNWQYSFTDLPRYEFTRDADKNITAVREIEYTVEETEVEGYTSVVDGYNITNTRTGVVDLTVNKVWVDTEDAESSEIEIQLYANGQAYGDAVWMSDTYTFDDLPKYDEYGLEITWSVQETVIPMGYTPSYSDVEADGQGNLSVTITNIQNIIDDTLTVTVTKVWQQPSDIAPQTAYFSLYADGEEVANKKLALTGNNIGSFSGLRKYKTVTDAETGETDLVEIRYAVYEDIPSGYESNLSNKGNLIANSNGDMVYHFVNTIEDEISVSVQKQWVKPATVETPDVTFTVKRAIGSGEAETVGTIVLENGESSGKLSGLDEYNEYGQRYSYSIVEESLSGYSAAITGGVQADGNYVYDVVNTINQANVDLRVFKKWIDGGLDASERPSVKLWVLQNGMDGGLYNGQPDVRWVEFYYDATEGAVMAMTQDNNVVAATVSEDGNTWSYTFQLPKYSQDRTLEYIYSVAEYDVPAGYRSVVEEGTTVYNTRVGTIDIPVTKYWVDPAGTDRPEITLTLSGTDESTRTIVMDDVDGIVTATVNGVAIDVTAAGNAWTVTLEGLPQYDNAGAKIAYSLTENAVSGYDQEEVEGNPFAVLNRIQQEANVTATATKAWVMDTSGVNKSVYPDSITVALLRDGIMVEASKQTVEKGENDIYTILPYENLEKYDTADGHVYKYEVVELNKDDKVVANGGTVSFGRDNDYTVSYEDGIITNTYKVPAKYFWYVTTYYKHYDADGKLIADESFNSDTYAEEISQTVTVKPDDYKTHPENGKTYTYVEEAANVTEVELVRINHLYQLVLHYELRDVKQPGGGGGNGGGNGGGGNVPPVIIEEEEPPLAELPEEEPPLAELPEEEVPLAAVPMTGDTTALYALLAMGSAMGLMYLFLTGKKREEEI